MAQRILNKIHTVQLQRFDGIGLFIIDQPSFRLQLLRGLFPGQFLIQFLLIRLQDICQFCRRLFGIFDLRRDDDHRSRRDVLGQHRPIAAVDRSACPRYREVTLPQVHRPLQDRVMMKDLFISELGQDAGKDEHSAKEDTLMRCFTFPLSKLHHHFIL